MSNVVKPGKYIAKIVDAMLMTSAAGNPMVAIMMEFKDEAGNPRRMTWFGATAGGAREITIPTLVRCGFKSDDLADVSLGKEAFNYDSDYEVVVDNEPNPKKGNALEPRLKWINLVGGGTFRERMTKEDAVKLTSGMNFKADFMDARQKAGKPKAEPVAAVPAAVEPTMDEADLPF